MLLTRNLIPFRNAIKYVQGAPVNTYVIVARTSSKAVSELERKGPLSRVWKLWDRLDVELRLFSWQAAAWLVGIRHFMKRLGFS